MGMVFCRGCGTEIHESAPTCPHCGAAQGVSGANQTGGWGSGMAWVIACAPLIGAFAEGFFSALFHYAGGMLFMVSVGINVFLCTKDEQNLKASGTDTSALGNTWLVPLYLFNRAKTLGEKPAYAILWCILFLAQIGAI